MSFVADLRADLRGIRVSLSRSFTEYFLMVVLQRQLSGIAMLNSIFMFKDVGNMNLKIKKTYYG
jgi:hypothetical protein